MEEKQFELAGVTFGLGTDFPFNGESGWSPGSPVLRSTDVDMPGSNGRRFGRVFKGQTTWAFSLHTNADTEEEGWEMLARLETAWRSLEDEVGIVLEDSVLPLRYKVAGKTREVWGQPKRFTPVIDNLSLSGRIPVEADFELVAPIYLDTYVNSKALQILPPLDLEAGLVVPFVAPFESSPQSDTLQSQITIGGEVSTPLTVIFTAGTGPLTNPQVTIGDRRVFLNDQVLVGDPVTADARPWVNSIVTESGGPVSVTPRVTRISQLWLPPGDHAVTFNGSDPTSTASIEVRWQDAYRTLR